MSRDEVIVTATRSARNSYSLLTISEPPFYQLVVVKRELGFAPFSDFANSDG